MPNHCYNAKVGGDSHPKGSTNFAEIAKYQFTVDFNAYPLSMESANGAAETRAFNQTVLRTQREVDAMLCSEGNFDFLLIDKFMDYTESVEYRGDTASPWENKYTMPLGDDLLPSSNMVVGVTLNGVFLFSGAHHFYIDGFFPKQWSG